LQELGFGLDLSECAATGGDTELVYVSPRSGRAVSREAGEPYDAKLLKLPAFLRDDDAAASEGDLVAGFALTGYFLKRDVLAPHGLAMPETRERLIGLLARRAKLSA
jgi:DNA repair protein RecO (recombination protein O)